MGKSCRKILRTGEVYEGECVNWQREGKGKMITSTGICYIGDWKENKMHGHGTITFPSGQKYVGAHEDGKRNGHAIYTYQNGDTWEGTYVDNYKDGTGIFTRHTGEIWERTYEKGLFTLEVNRGMTWDPEQATLVRGFAPPTAPEATRVDSRNNYATDVPSPNTAVSQVVIPDV